jgi:hypothetical protein
MPSIEAMLITLAGRAADARGRAQHRRQRLGEEERRLEVERHHLVPAALREFVEVRAPCRARIVDQDVELRLALADLGGEHLDACHRRDVDRQRDAFTGIFAGQFLRGRLAGRRFSRSDVDLRRPLAEKSRRDHPPDAARAAGHQRDAPGQ